MQLTRCDLCNFESATYPFNKIHEMRKFQERTMPMGNEKEPYVWMEQIFDLDLCEDCFYNYTRKVEELKKELKKK